MPALSYFGNIVWKDVFESMNTGAWKDVFESMNIDVRLEKHLWLTDMKPPNHTTCMGTGADRKFFMRGGKGGVGETSCAASLTQ